MNNAMTKPDAPSDLSGHENELGRAVSRTNVIGQRLDAVVTRIYGGLQQSGEKQGGGVGPIAVPAGFHGRLSESLSALQANLDVLDKIMSRLEGFA